jgi:hypothetical protein
MVYGYNQERKPLSRRKQAMVCMVMDMSEVKLAVGSLFCGHSFFVVSGEGRQAAFALINE